MELGPAKLQRTVHTLIHAYDTNTLYTEFINLRGQFRHFNKNASENPQLVKILEPQVRTINFTILQIQDKLNFIKPSVRSKRGLINILGSGIKALTGNLDDSDGERITKLLDQLKNGETILENQVKNEYSISTNLVNRFEHNLEIIKHNEENFRSKMIEYDRVYNAQATSEKLLTLKEIFNQFAISLLNFLNLVTDIEDSILFCHVNKLHPSIMKSQDLFNELIKIEKYYGEELPLPVLPENIPQFEELAEIACDVSPTKITYFISIPINHKTSYTLFYLLPIPTSYQSEFITVRVPHRYVLKDGQEVLPLSQRCSHLQQYQCNHPDLHGSSTCENTLLNAKSSADCEHVKVDLPRNHLEAIPESSQYLGIFTTPEAVKLNCPTKHEETILTGIYLISPDICEFIFRNRSLPKALFSETKPVFFHNKLLLDLAVPELKTQLRFTKLSPSEELVDMIPPNLNIKFSDSHAPPYFTYLLIGLITTASCILLSKFRRSRTFRHYSRLIQRRTRRFSAIAPAEPDRQLPIIHSEPIPNEYTV